VPGTPADWFDRPLAEVDPQIAHVLESELERQRASLELIASENSVPRSVLECQGSVLTNKYAEGYPGRRYYGGCQWVDVAEQLAIDRSRELFGAEHANVQPHSGAQANAAVYHALLRPGETIMGMRREHGGHFTHGTSSHLSGRLYEVASYGAARETLLLDMDEVAAVARAARPRLLIAGWSTYPRQLDFAAFRRIADEVGALLMVDMAHFAGLVAAGLHPSPVPYADVVTSTTHKTLGGARGGLILCRREHADAIDAAVFPGQQGGPLAHAIAGKAVAFKLAGTPGFRERLSRALTGATALASRLDRPREDGVAVWSGGTDVHAVVVDLRDAQLDGHAAEQRLEEIGITANRAPVPFDPRRPSGTSGVRLGTPALAARGFDAVDFAELGELLSVAFSPRFATERDELRDRCAAIAARHPLYPHLSAS
jgi:glycine hydroxymethyltransferase